ncbi:hypothetical protein GDO86_019804, partial [Hymenochirus boettgeri]
FVSSLCPTQLSLVGGLPCAGGCDVGSRWERAVRCCVVLGGGCPVGLRLPCETLQGKGTPHTALCDVNPSISCSRSSPLGGGEDLAWSRTSWGSEFAEPAEQCVWDPVLHPADPSG